ncbi:hypothetical protein JYU34_005988 [Plutella xylostella]|uniref:Uncharacterized protein n=1 Tax=Plutella xylostella TaxID=51655 RepID=A0ABQ7QUN7_PLUXY|nr:hypothetical protein JYU34_005988 [Plutella xylostella]
MPATDVGDLRDVVDAINKLCDDMKTSTYDEEVEEETTEQPEVAEHQYKETAEQETTEQAEVEVHQYRESTEQTRQVEETSEQTHVEVTHQYEEYIAEDKVETPQYTEYRDVELANPEDICVQRVETFHAVETYHAERTETYNTERWSDSASQLSVPDVTSDAPAHEPVSEMYFTASSEVSLLSDTELPDRPMEDSICSQENKDERKEVVIAGHVAAMRERFESMTRANTPCPDLLRSLSPSLDAIRGVTPEPDLG